MARKGNHARPHPSGKPEGKRIIIKRVRKKKVNQKEVGSWAACIDGFGRNPKEELSLC
jgi:hypothetical protein